MRTVLSVVVLLVALIPSSATASMPASMTEVGVAGTWPAAKGGVRTVMPGHVVRVRLAQRSVPAEVALLRTTAGGRVLRAVARRSVARGGTFRATVPAVLPARYQLRLRARGRTVRTWLQVAAPPAPLPAPVAGPVVHPCPTGTPDARLEPPAVTGATVASVAVNTGTTCLVPEASLLERATSAGAWEPVAKASTATPLVPGPTMLPGGSAPTSFVAKDPLVAGSYRLTVWVTPMDALTPALAQRFPVLTGFAVT